MRSRKYDDRTGGIADAPCSHRTNQDLADKSVPSTAHDEQTGMPRCFDEPLHRWSFDDLERQRHVIPIGGDLVDLVHLGCLSGFPGLTCDRCLAHTADMLGVTKGCDDLHGPAPPTAFLHRPLQRPIARR